MAVGLAVIIVLCYVYALWDYHKHKHEPPTEY